VDKINDKKYSETEPFKDKEWLGVKKAIQYILMLTIIILSGVLISAIFTQGQGSTDIDYSFSQETPYTNYSAMPITNHNLRHNDILTQNYNASYSFVNDTGLTGINIPFIKLDSNSISSVVSEYDNHDTVLKMDDNSAGAGYNVATEFLIAQTSGSIEYWFQLDNDASASWQFRLMEPITNTIGIFLSFDQTSMEIGIRESGVWNYFSDFVYDAWYHIVIDFECGGGAYLGLAPDTLNIVVNDYDYGVFDFDNAVSDIDEFRFYTGIATNGKGYIDGVGYSWLSNYTKGVNRIPIIIDLASNVLSADRYEFAMKDDGTAHTDDTGITAGTILGFEGGTDPSVDAEIDNDEIEGLPYDNYRLRILATTGTGRYIFNDTLGITTPEINVSYAWRYEDGYGGIESTGVSRLQLWSEQENEIVRLEHIYATDNRFTVQYYDGVGYNSLVDFYDYSDGLNSYGFNLFISDFTVDLLTYINDTFNSSYSFSTIVDEFGLSEIRYTGIDDNGGNGDYWICQLDYIGIYQQNISVCTELGYLSYDIGTDWISTEYNLFSFNSENESIQVNTMGGYTDKQYKHLTIEPIIIRTFDTTMNHFSNLYEEGYDWMSFGTTKFIFIPETYITNTFNFSIEGILLSDGTTDYFAEYTSNNVDTDVSYYSVSGNRLRYSVLFDDSGSLENMEIIFDINNLLSVNRSIVFSSWFDSVGESNFWIEYTDATLNLFELVPYLSSENLILPQDKVIDEFHWSITDNNNNGLNGSIADGYITTITLRYVPNIDVSITTLSLLVILVPILILMIPTVVMYAKFGKQAVLPMLILMSIVCLVGGLIDAWLFMIIVLGLGALLIFQIKQGGQDSLV
jgi:hypothetical protein